MTFPFPTIPPSSFKYTITLSSTSSVDAYAVAIADGWNGTMLLEVIVPSSLTIIGTTATTPAITFNGGSFPKGAILINEGTIYGRGGNGSNGGNGYGSCYDFGSNSVQAQQGGTAVYAHASNSLTIINNGTIAGGGGGGRGGNSSQLIYGGGGGGGGVPYGAGAAAGLYGGASAGSAASLTTAGNGGAGVADASACGIGQWSSSGGEGGGLGEQGWTGQTMAAGYNDRWQRTGGAAGYSVFNYSNVTFSGNALIGPTA